MIKYSGLNHLAFATGNMDKTVRFWRDLIGMRLIAAMGKKGFKQYIFEMSKNDLLVFFEWPEIEPVEEKGHGSPTKGCFSFDHVSIGVESNDDLFHLKDRLNAADIWVSEVLDHEVLCSIYTFDPNGIAVEFSACPKGQDLRKSPVFSDKDMSPIAKEGPEPNFAAWPEVKKPTCDEEKKIYKGDFFLIE